MGVFRKNGSYWIDYYVNGRRRREKVGDSKTLAENALMKRKVQIAEGRFLDIQTRCSARFRDFSKEYLDLHAKVNHKSWKKSDSTNINMLNKHFGDMFLDEIGVSDVEKFKSERLQVVSPARVNRNVATLKAMLNRAVEWGIIKTNVVRGVKKVTENNKRLRYLEKDEIRKLIGNCCESLRPIVMTAVYTGMRLGEILPLEWKNIDLKRNIIYILDSKNGEAREIPIHEDLRKCLELLYSKKGSKFVFAKKNGFPYKDIRASFFTALKSSGIFDFRFHDLRHTFASHLVMAGIDMAIVSNLLGHKSLAMTQRYAHLSPSYKSKAVSYLDFSDGHYLDTGRISAKETTAETFQNILKNIEL